MVMRRILVLFLAVSMACNAYGAIAVVDIDKVITNSVAYKKFKIGWEKNNIKYQSEIASYEKKMIDLDREINSRSESGELKEISKLKVQLSEYEMMIQKLVEKRKNILDRSFSNAISQIKTHMIKLIEDYSKKNSIEIVVSKSQTIYSDAQHDITDEVLKSLNKELNYIEDNTERTVQ